MGGVIHSVGLVVERGWCVVVGGSVVDGQRGFCGGVGGERSHHQPPDPSSLPFWPSRVLGLPSCVRSVAFVCLFVCLAPPTPPTPNPHASLARDVGGRRGGEIWVPAVSFTVRICRQLVCFFFLFFLSSFNQLAHRECRPGLAGGAFGGLFPLRALPSIVRREVGLESICSGSTRIEGKGRGR